MKHTKRKSISQSKDQGSYEDQGREESHNATLKIMIWLMDSFMMFLMGFFS